MIGMSLRLLLASLFAATVLSAAEISVIDEIICKVNGEIVTRGDIERARRQMEAALRQQGNTGDRLAEAVKEASPNLLRERIDNLLLLSRGKELNINVDQDVNKQIAEIQRQTKIADPEKFQAYVKQETGQNFEDFKSEMKNQAITQRVIRQEVASKILIKREESQAYYELHKDEFQRDERVFLREILVASDGKDTAAAEKKAKDLSDRGKKGEKFEDLAQNNSDSASAPQGGEIGSFEKGKIGRAHV